MVPKKLKSLIDEYCMGVTPTDQQMDEIMDLAIALNADSAEVSKYMNKMISGPTKEELEKEKKIKAEKAKVTAKKKTQEEAAELYKLGMAYRDGKGVDGDVEKAAELWTRASKLGHKNAVNKLFDLGQMYYNGDKVFSAKCYAVAAEYGHVYAQVKLGFMYKKGLGVKQNFQKAVELYKKAAEQKDDSAFNNLGVCYENGEGVTCDYVTAVQLYNLAIKYNPENEAAHFHLGECYEKGKGVKRDKSIAKKYYKKAIELGDDRAEEALKRLNRFFGLF